MHRVRNAGALRAHCVMLGPSLCPQEQHVLRKAQENNTNTQFITIVIFSEGMFICPYPEQSGASNRFTVVRIVQHLGALRGHCVQSAPPMVEQVPLAVNPNVTNRTQKP